MVKSKDGAPNEEVVPYGITSGMHLLRKTATAAFKLGIDPLGPVDPQAYSIFDRIWHEMKPTTNGPWIQRRVGFLCRQENLCLVMMFEWQCQQRYNGQFTQS